MQPRVRQQKKGQGAACGVKMHTAAPCQKNEIRAWVSSLQ